MKEFDFGFAVVRIHEGKLSEEERRVVLENAAKGFYKRVQKASSQKAAVDQIHKADGNCSCGSSSHCCSAIG